MHGHRTVFGSREEPVTHKKESPSSTCLYALHLGLDFLEQCLQLVHIRRLSRPLDTQSLRLVRFRNLQTQDTYQRPEPAIRASVLFGTYHVKMHL